jgi:phosphoribosylanthranilate isomerase
LQQQYHDAAGLLLDAYHPGVQGGSGSGFDWDLIPTPRSLPIILAGGLTPENAGEAIKTVKPYALDVSSGVEAEKGIKDAAKMAAFIRKTNQAT